MTSIIAAGGMIIASIFASWATANNRVGQAETKIEVIKTTEDLHYKEVQKQLDGIDKKLDTLIGKNKSEVVRGKIMV